MGRSRVRAASIAALHRRHAFAFLGLVRDLQIRMAFFGREPHQHHHADLREDALLSPPMRFTPSKCGQHAHGHDEDHCSGW